LSFYPDHVWLYVHCVCGWLIPETNWSLTDLFYAKYD